MKLGGSTLRILIGTLGEDDLHSIPSDLPACVLHRFSFWGPVDEDRIGVVDVRVDAAACTEVCALSKRAAGIADWQVGHVFGATLGEPGAGKLVRAPEGSVEQEHIEPVRMRDHVVEV